MSAETLDAEYYRGRAHLCHQLADSARAAKPLFARLCLLAQAYETKANAAESKQPVQPAGKRAVGSSSVGVTVQSLDLCA